MHGVVDGVLLPDPVHPRHSGQFLPAHDDRRARPGLPPHQSAELVSSGDRRPVQPVRDAGRRRRYRLDLLHSLQHHLLEHVCDRHRAGHLHRGLLVDPDRPELHRHRPPHARARHDVVPHAAVRLGELCHQPDPGARHARCSPSLSCCSLCERAVAHRHLRSRAAAAIRCCSSTSSGSIRIPPCTSWCCPPWA